MTTTFRRKDGRTIPIKDQASRAYTYSKQMTYQQIKKAKIHGLFISGYLLDLADNERKKFLQRAIKNYGKSEVIAELGNLRKTKAGNKRAERVIDSDLSYMANGKFEED